MPPPRSRNPQRLRNWCILGGGAAALLLWLGGLWHLANQPRAVRLSGVEWVADTGRYAGAEVCRACHAEIVERQLASNHARTARDLTREKPLAPFDTAQPVIDPFAGVAYEMTGGGGAPQLTLTQGKLRANQKLLFEFGSGAHAHGYLARLDNGQWIDARLNYYHKTGAWDFASSQDKPQSYLKTQPLGRPQSPDRIARCFMCHSTVLRADGVGKAPLDGSQLRVRPDRSELGVTCESCHGPRADHARDRHAGKPGAAPAAMSAASLNELCGRCHGFTNVNPAHPVVARFQPWGLSQSRCYLASSGRLSCVTCHDPHENVRHDTAFYEKKCLGCHSGGAAAATQPACPVDPKQGCVGCHMPRDSKSMLHITFTDHRIRIERKPDALRLPGSTASSAGR